MKKFFLLCCALTATMASFAQTIPGGDMEVWRNSTSGSVAAVPVHAPASWFGIDSLIIGIGESFLDVNPDHPWNTQIFQENTIIHSGSSSAKIMTRSQDTLGYVPGILSNAQASVNLLALLGGASPLDAISYSGGTPVTLRITTVSAYTEYFPGIDTNTHLMGGQDTAIFTVEAHGTVGGADSILGRGFAVIPPASSFTQVTATMVYTDTINLVNNMRFFFFSSGGASQTLDSSTLYVDDVTMTGVPEFSHAAVNNVVSASAIKVYPNPATNTIFLEGPVNAGLTYTLLSVNGQIVASKVLTGSDAVDVSGLASGNYFYTITDKAGKAIQKGNITLNR